MAQDMVLQLLDTLQRGVIECITIGGVDIVYIQHSDEWVLSAYGGGCTSYDDIYECSGAVLALIQ